MRPARPVRGPTASGPDAAGARDPGQASGYAASADANSGGEAAEGRRRQAPKVADPTSRRRGGSTEQERLDELKGVVHAELLQQLGPQLYDANLEASELELQGCAPFWPTLSLPATAR